MGQIEYSCSESLNVACINQIRLVNDSMQMHNAISWEQFEQAFHILFAFQFEVNRQLKRNET